MFSNMYDNYIQSRDLYYEYGEDYEEEGEFVDSGGVNKIRLFNEETDDNNLDIIYDER